MKEVSQRFLKYIKIDSQADESSSSIPSSKGQLELGRLLLEELKELGLKDISQDEFGYVQASLEANSKDREKTLAFFAHLDSSPEVSGKNIKAQIIKNYQGEDIILNKEKNIILSAKEFPSLKKYIGQDLITSDGTTLLAADDKAGIAAIMTALSHLQKNPSIKHGPLKVVFTPDEEIGRGLDNFDLEKLGADYAYTIDGGEVGELNYETFNAAKALVKIRGKSVHTGSAKNTMLNAIELAHEFHRMLASNEKPEYTEAYEGFFHLENIKGSVEEAELFYLIRDHSLESFQKRKTSLENIQKFLNTKYGQERISLEIEDQYFNMKEKIEEEFHLVENAKKAIEEAGLEAKIVAIRGGTDGARLSFSGLPCPNIFAGGENFHSRYEYLPIQSMEKASQVIINIIKKY